MIALKLKNQALAEPPQLPSIQHWPEAMTDSPNEASPAEPPQLSPIQHWLAAMTDDSNEASKHLQAAYRENRPTQGELIFTGACEFTCQHCIYPPSFAKYNRPMPAANWKPLLEDIHTGLGINTFVYGGRSVTADGLEVLAWLRSRFPAARIGLIDNGISMLPVRERILEVQADWLDVSLDGLEDAHDLQRGRSGSYQAGLEGALWLIREGMAPKVNILSCLTKLNRHSIVPMIRDLNAQGFKNFFVTPITIVGGTHLAPELALSAVELTQFIHELSSNLESLDDAWVEINMFSENYAQAVAMMIPDMWQGFEPDRDGLVWRDASARHSGTDFFVWYYPTSLTGTRELIVNTKGDVIVPKSMGYGNVARDQILGNLRHTRGYDLLEQLPDTPAFGFYRHELANELNTLKEYF